jgi:hypothetical protein
MSARCYIRWLFEASVRLSVDKIRFLKAKTIEKEER